MRIDKQPALLAAFGLIVTLAGGAAPAQTAPDLPGGASALRERHGDWTVSCQMVQDDTNAAKTCALSQEQVNPRKQRTIAINLVPRENGAEGAIILPFGLALTRGVALEVDGIALGQPWPFSTCLQFGCIVPLSLDADALARLGGGKQLTVAARSLTDQKVTLSVSLNGIASAIDRTKVLLN